MCGSTRCGCPLPAAAKRSQRGRPLPRRPARASGHADASASALSCAVFVHLNKIFTAALSSCIKTILFPASPWGTGVGTTKEILISSLVRSKIILWHAGCYKSGQERTGTGREKNRRENESNLGSTSGHHAGIPVHIYRGMPELRPASPPKTLFLRHRRSTYRQTSEARMKQISVTF